MASIIVNKDLADLSNSDGVIVYFDKPSVGTSMEVFFAHADLGIPVVVVNKSGKAVSPWLSYHSNLVVDDLSAGVAALSAIIDMRNE
jgi:nucleoside 2-deoxyribosyltransferase